MRVVFFSNNVPTHANKALNPLYIEREAHPIKYIDFPASWYISTTTFHQFPSVKSGLSHLFLADLSAPRRIAVAGGWKNTAVTPPSDIQFPPRHRSSYRATTKERSQPVAA